MDAQREQAPLTPTERVPVNWQAPMAQILFGEQGLELPELTPLHKQLIERTFDPRSCGTISEPEGYPHKKSTSRLRKDDIPATPFGGSKNLDDDLKAALQERRKEQVEESGIDEKTTYLSTPTLTRWVLPVLLQQGYRIVSSFDMRALAAANDAGGMVGGDIALRRLETTLNSHIGATSDFEEGKVSESLLISLGGDEYVIVTRNPSRTFPIEELNNALLGEEIPFTDFDREPETYVKTLSGYMPIVREEKPIDWRSLEVAEKEVPPGVDHLLEDGGYTIEYGVLFDISEEQYNTLDIRTHQILRESVFDPVFLGRHLVKRPDDALKVFNAQNPETEPLAIACSAMGLKEANKSNDGDEFLKEYYDVLEDTLLNVLKVDQDAFTITRNRGSTFLILVNPEKAGMNQESGKVLSLISAVTDHVTTTLKSKGNKLNNHISFPGIAFQEGFHATPQEVISLVDQCNIWEIIQMMKEIDSPIDYEPELKEYAIEYLNDDDRGTTRKLNFARAVGAIIAYLTATAGKYIISNTPDSFQNTIQSYLRLNEVYGLRSNYALVDGSRLLPPEKMSALYGILPPKLDDDDEEDV